MRAITLHYTLRNGQAGVLPWLGRSTADAICWAMAHFGLQLRTCAARPATAGTSQLQHHALPITEQS